MSTTHSDQTARARRAALKFAHLLENATSDGTLRSIEPHTVNAADIWNALAKEAQDDPQLALAATQAKHDCLDARSHQALTELTARAAIAWGNHIANIIRGRSSDLLIHVIASKGQAAIWAEELDPTVLVQDPAGHIFWMTAKPANMEEKIHAQYHPNAASLNQISWALRLQDASANPGEVRVETEEGLRKAPAIFLVKSEARHRLQDATAPKAHVTIRLDPETHNWLNSA